MHFSRCNTAAEHIVTLYNAYPSRWWDSKLKRETFYANMQLRIATLWRLVLVWIQDPRITKFLWTAFYCVCSMASGHYDRRWWVPAERVSMNDLCEAQRRVVDHLSASLITALQSAIVLFVDAVKTSTCVAATSTSVERLWCHSCLVISCSGATACPFNRVSA